LLCRGVYLSLLGAGIGVIVGWAAPRNNSMLEG